MTGAAEGVGRDLRRLAAALLMAGLVATAACAAEVAMRVTMTLPPPAMDAGHSLEQALHERRSVRTYGAGALSLAELSQLLWSAQGVTAPAGQRTAPSAGALYPLELRVVVGAVAGLEPGLYRYRPAGHRLERSDARDPRPALAAAHGQSWVQENAALVILSAEYTRTTCKYGQRGVRYAHLEAGHAAQNLLLTATALGLGSVIVGAFDDTGVARALDLPPGETPLALIPLGRPPNVR